jgi:hypothetical protein
VHLPATGAGAEEAAEFDEELSYEPLPADEVKTVRVKFRFVGEGEPLPYVLDNDELDALNDLEEA